MLQLNDLTPVIHHDANLLGKDYVVGDLHGCPSMLMELLDHVHFDVAKDRVFSTGDLVDRGPDDIGSLALLEEPWFYPVMGNHDAMMLAAMHRLQSHLYANAFYYNGGSTAQFKDRPNAVRYLDMLEKLPLIRVVGKDTDSRFQVLHAERMTSSGDALSDEVLDGPLDAIREKMDETSWIEGFDAKGNWVDRLMWGRSLRHSMGTEYDDRTDADTVISRNFVGHTITVPKESGRILQYRYHVFLDTGGYMVMDHAGPNEADSFGLTLWDAHENKGWTRHNSGIHEATLLDIEDVHKSPRAR